MTENCTCPWCLPNEVCPAGCPECSHSREPEPTPAKAAPTSEPQHGEPEEVSV